MNSHIIVKISSVSPWTWSNMIDHVYILITPLDNPSVIFFLDNPVVSEHYNSNWPLSLPFILFTFDCNLSILS